MYLGELEGVGHVSLSWTRSDFDHYRCPSLSLVRAYRWEIRRV